LALVGGLLFTVLVARPALARTGTPALVDAYDRRMRRLGRIACAGVVVAALVGVVFQAANASDVSPLEAIGAPVVRLLGTRLGALWQARIACALLLAVASWLLRGRLHDAFGLAVGGTMLLGISLSSHAAAVPTGTWLTVLAD